MARMGIVSNTNANRQNNGGLHATLADLACSMTNLRHLVTHDPAQVSNVLRIFRNEGVEVLVSDGGDGALSELVTHELRSRNGVVQSSDHYSPLFVPLNTGTVNVMANHLGIVDNPLEVLSYLSSRTRMELDATSQRIPTLEVAPADEARRYGFIYGNGVVYTVFELYQDAIQRSKNAFWATMRILGSLLHRKTRSLYRPVELVLQRPGYENHRKPYPYTGMVAGTRDLQVAVPHLPFRLFDDAQEGYLHLVTTKRHLKLLELLKQGWHLAWGKKPNGPLMDNGFVPYFDLTGKRGDLAYQLDGTNYRLAGDQDAQTSCRVAVGPKVLLVGMGR